MLLPGNKVFTMSHRDEVDSLTCHSANLRLGPDGIRGWMVCVKRQTVRLSGGGQTQRQLAPGLTLLLTGYVQV